MPARKTFFASKAKAVAFADMVGGVLMQTNEYDFVVKWWPKKIR